MTELTEVKERLQKARGTLYGLYCDAWDMGRLNEAQRLQGKLEGISLAISYLVETEDLVEA